MLSPERIWSSPQLPTLPTVATELLDESQKPEVEIAQIVEIIKKDPAISAKILKATNSSFFGFRTPITSIEKAVPLLGTTVVTSLALSFSLADSASSKCGLRMHFQEYWRQSVIQAIAAEELGRSQGSGDPAECFLAGLLCDLGRLAMLKTIATHYEQVCGMAKDDMRSLAHVERDVLGFDHVEIGVQLMKNWSLPAPVVEAARMQHAAPSELAGATALQKAIATASAVGDVFCGHNKGESFDRLSELVVDHSTTAEDLLAVVRTRVEEVATVFSIDPDSIAQTADLMAMANEQIAKLAWKEHNANAQSQAKQQQMQQQQQQLEDEKRQLERQVVRDGLTGSFNRKYFDEVIRQEMHRCRRLARTVGVLFVDIDHFKDLNDSRGHAFGDEVLKKVAKALQDSLRRSDTLARYGGEEFVALLVNPTEKSLERVSDRLRAAVESLEIETNGESVPVTVSVGAAMCIPRRAGTSHDDIDPDDETARQLITTADHAMYQSKQNGRNRVTVELMMAEDEVRIVRNVMACRFSQWLASLERFDLHAILRAVTSTSTPRKLFGEICIEMGWLTADDVSRVLEHQQANPDRFGTVAKRLGLLSEAQLVQALIIQQEDPAELATSIVENRLTNRTEADRLLENYLTDIPGKIEAATEPAGV